MPNGATGAPGLAAPSGAGSNFLPSNGRVIQSGGVRILCVADVRGMSCLFSSSLTPDSRPFMLTFTCFLGNLKSLNDLAKQARADYIIHTGDFGFYDESSLDRIADKYLLQISLINGPLSRIVALTYIVGP